MVDNGGPVKCSREGHADRPRMFCRECWLYKIDSHPRVGWYVAGVSTLNLILQVINIFHG